LELSGEYVRSPDCLAWWHRSTLIFLLYYLSILFTRYSI